MSLKRGEIYFVNLNPVQGREQSGERPVLIISSDSINQLPLVVTVVVGTKGANIAQNYPTNVRVAAVDSGLAIETIFLCFQLRSLDASRFTNAVAGKLNTSAMQKIENALRYCLGLS
jgi:mRNA interferase MazF